MPDTNTLATSLFNALVLIIVLQSHNAFFIVYCIAIKKRGFACDEISMHMLVLICECACVCVCAFVWCTCVRGWVGSGCVSVRLSVHIVFVVGVVCGLRGTMKLYLSTFGSRQHNKRRFVGQ
jgi:hypothetical protein